MKNKKNNEKGSLALEQILFIGAVVVLAGGIGAFYSNLGDYFSAFDFSSVATSVESLDNTTVDP